LPVFNCQKISFFSKIITFCYIFLNFFIFVTLKYNKNILSFMKISQIVICVLLIVLLIILLVGCGSDYGSGNLITGGSTVDVSDSDGESDSSVNGEQTGSASPEQASNEE